MRPEPGSGRLFLLIAANGAGMQSRLGPTDIPATLHVPKLHYPTENSASSAWHRACHDEPGLSNPNVRRTDRGNFKNDSTTSPDIPLLFDVFVRRYSRGRSTPFAVDPQVFDMLAADDWPGNVRELENAVERSIALNTTGILAPGDFSDELRTENPGSRLFSGPLMPMGEIERRYAEYVVSRVDGNMTRAAEILEIDRRTLYRILDRRAESQD